MMSKEILQLENLNGQDFKNEIITAVQDEFRKLNHNANDQDKLMSRQETADFFNVSLVTIWSWTNKNIITGWRIGNKVRYKKSEIIAALEKMNNFST